MPDMEEFRKPEFEINGTHYEITKMRSMPGFALLEQIRQNLGLSFSALAEIRNGNLLEADAMTALAQTLLCLPPDFVELVRKKLFEGVSFRNEEVKTALPLAGKEQMAIKEPFEVYELIARCLAVNFIPSSLSNESNLIESLSSILPQGLQMSQNSSPE